MQGPAERNWDYRPSTGVRGWRMHDEPEYAEKWQALADQIHQDSCAKGVDDRGVFVQRYRDVTALDASLLLLPLMRFLPPDDPRVRATVIAIAGVTDDE